MAYGQVKRCISKPGFLHVPALIDSAADSCKVWHLKTLFQVVQMRFQLVALDLDGTLVGEDMIVPVRTRRAVERAMDRGCLVTIATGRGFPPAVRFARDLGLNAPLICYQGALIRDHRDGSIIHSETVPLDVAREVIVFSQARRYNVQAYMEEDRAYVDHVDELIARMADIAQVPVTGVGNLASWLNRPPLKFLFFVEEREAAPELVRDLHAQFNGRVQVVQSWYHLVEVTGPNVSKGEALAKLSAHLGVPQSTTIAIGDQDNDVSMIAWAGLGVAMGDASPGAKAAASLVAPPLAAQGAAWAIERYVLRELS
jgi:Cof subfamily protein (haloacid dehalogenase superfamily)